MNLARCKRLLIERIENKQRIYEKFLIDLGPEFVKFLDIKVSTFTKVPLGKPNQIQAQKRKAAIFCWINNYSPYCSLCGKEKNFLGLYQGYNLFCSSKCAGSEPETDKKRKQTNLKLYGKESHQSIPEIRQKGTKTMIEKYGAGQTMQIPELVTKVKDTLKQNYGVEYTFQSKEIIMKARKTNKEKYGVEHVMQCRHIHEKQQASGFKIKETIIKGKIFKTRGYEHIVIKHLAIELKTPVKNILTTHNEGVPSIQWEDTKKQKHLYHPDILVNYKNIKTLIEVKSTYTAGLRNDKNGLFSILKRKAKACEKAGYKFKLIIVSKCEKHLAVIENVTAKCRKNIMHELQNIHVAFAN